MGLERRTSGRVVLLDTSAFIMGYEPSDVDAEQYTVPTVREELRRESLPRLRLDTALQTGRLRLLSPTPRYMAETEAAASELGETAALSPADRELLALGLQLRSGGKSPVIVSDDYAVQNVADHLGLGYRGLATPGIKQRFNWFIYCPGCHRVFPTLPPGGVCPICGSAVKRKPGRKRPARGRVGS